MAFNGTGSNVTALNAANISSGTLAVGRGGTGATTLNSAAVIIGNGTSAPTFVAPGSNGNILTSNGTAWTSAAPAGGGVTSLNGQTGAITNTGVGDIGGYVSSPYAITSRGGVGATSVSSGSTISGSNLRVGASVDTAGTSGFSGGGPTTVVGDSQPWPAGGTTLSGTWRSITGCSIVVYASGCSVFSNWRVGLWVRIS
jgi:hypothetical protein